MCNSFCKSFRAGFLQISYYVYDPRKKSMFGRRPVDWVTLTAFQLIFLVFVGSFFVLTLQMTFLLVEKIDGPVPDLAHLSPGMCLYPILSLTNPILWLKENRTKVYVDSVLPVLNQQRNLMPRSNRTNEFGPCSSTALYNLYPLCVFLKINKIFRWTPKCYETPSELPLTMPRSLKKYVQKELATHSFHSKSVLWASCEGDKPIDRDNIGLVRHYPFPGFDADYFPYTRDEETPAIAVSLFEITRNLLITVRCTVYAKNIPSGHSAVFQIYLDTH